MSSVNATLYPVTFSDAVHDEAALSKFKILIGVTSALPPDDKNNLWCESPILFNVDLSDLEASLVDLAVKVEAKISVVGSKSKSDINASHLSKIWGIDVETSQKTIDIMSQLCKNNHPDHL